MSAESSAYVKVLKVVESWIEIYGVTLEEAEEIARKRDGVITVITSQWKTPEEYE